MAVRDGEPYLREAIDSVLGQSFGDFEFLIVDDGSTDATPEIAEGYRRRDSRIRLFRNETSLGPYPSTNLALSHARGDTIARHDGDDVSPPDRFAIQLSAFAAARDVSLVTGSVDMVDERGAVVGTLRPPTWQPRLEWELLFGNVIGAGAHIMFPRLIRGAPVRFPAMHPYSEDYGLWFTLGRLGTVVCPADVVYLYRRHGRSITGRARAVQHECFSQIRETAQSRYLSTIGNREVADELSRLWIEGAGRVPDVINLYPALLELKARFLDDIGERHGVADRGRIDAEIESGLDDRLAFWLFRSLRFADGRGCRDLLTIVRKRRTTARTAYKAAGNVFQAALRRARKAALPANR